MALRVRSTHESPSKRPPLRCGVGSWSRLRSLQTPARRGACRAVAYNAVDRRRVAPPSACWVGPTAQYSRRLWRPSSFPGSFGLSDLREILLHVRLHAHRNLVARHIPIGFPVRSFRIRVVCVELLISRLTSTVVSPDTVAARWPMISLILPIAFNCAASRISFGPVLAPDPAAPLPRAAYPGGTHLSLRLLAVGRWHPAGRPARRTGCFPSAARPCLLLLRALRGIWFLADC